MITWDLRGHGRSDSPDDPEQYSHAIAVADMAAVLDACGVSRVVACGLSLGGYLSLEFCLAHPDRVAGLVLCDTGPGYRDDQARRRWNERAVALAGRLERDGLAALAEGTETRGAGHRSARGLALAARGLLTQQDAHVMESLPSITVPALVLAGANDHAFLPAARYLADRMYKVQHAVIPDAGHACNADQPQLFNQHMMTFLEQVRSH